MTMTKIKNLFLNDLKLPILSKSPLFFIKRGLRGVQQLNDEPYYIKLNKNIS